MLCIRRDEQTFPCGQCHPCRVNARRVWTSRLLLESRAHPHSLFVTLTYDDDHIPTTKRHDATLKPRDLQLWLKRLRKIRATRFFAVGEYGDETWRPHYHAILFGYWPEAELRQVGRFRVHPIVQETWAKGFTSAEPMTPERAAYAAGYTVKKLTKSSAEWAGERLGTRRHPEFIRSSRRPGIGCHDAVIHTLAEAIVQADPEAEDVPPVWHWQGRQWPMPSIIAGKVRYELGMERLAKDRPPRAVVESPYRTPEEVAHAEKRSRRAVARYYQSRKRLLFNGRAVK